MKVEQKTVPAMTLERFADAHGLTMKINERAKPEGDPGRFYASFKGCEIMDGGCLIGAFGNGSTPEEAMAEYAEEINLKRLAIDAHTPDRREIAPHRITAD